MLQLLTTNNNSQRINNFTMAWLRALIVVKTSEEQTKTELKKIIIINLH